MNKLIIAVLAAASICLSISAHERPIITTLDSTNSDSAIISAAAATASGVTDGSIISCTVTVNPDGSAWVKTLTDDNASVAKSATLSSDEVHSFITSITRVVEIPADGSEIKSVKMVMTKRGKTVVVISVS